MEARKQTMEALEDALLASGYGIEAPIPSDLLYSVPTWVFRAREAVQAERTAKKQQTAWQAFWFVVAVLVASILGLFGLPLLLIYFTRGGC